MLRVTPSMPLHPTLVWTIQSPTYTSFNHFGSKIVLPLVSSKKMNVRITILGNSKTLNLEKPKDTYMWHQNPGQALKLRAMQSK